jgi:hypothetical protein
MQQMYQTGVQTRFPALTSSSPLPLEWPPGITRIRTMILSWQIYGVMLLIIAIIDIAMWIKVTRSKEELKWQNTLGAVGMMVPLFPGLLDLWRSLH